MRILKNTVAIMGVFILLSIAAPFFPADAADGGNGGGFSVNLTVEQVTVSPIRAYVGDQISVDVVIDNREDGSDTSQVRVYANKKVVGRQLFQWGTPGADRKSNMSFKWDTSGMAPGVYKIKAEVVVFEDISPFDNEITLEEPVILVAPGEQFPAGASAGGSTTEIDPRYKK